MKPIIYVLAALTVGAGAWYATRDEAPAIAVASAAPVAASASPVAAPAVAAPAADVPVEQLVADANSGDAARRAAAITALAQAPRAQAVPALQRVLLNGEPSKDRPLALQSLRDLALEQGDADGAVRQAIRDALYHGDDQMPAEAVQEALDVVEESELHRGK